MPNRYGTALSSDPVFKHAIVDDRRGPTDLNQSSILVQIKTGHVSVLYGKTLEL